MFIAYLDDSGSNKDKQSDLVIVGALVVDGNNFGYLEQHVRVAVEHLIPEDRLDKSEEFHAYDLFNLTPPVFENLDPAKVKETFDILLFGPRVFECPYIYAAVSKKAVKATPFNRVSPLSVAFSACLKGIEDWARAQHEHPRGILTVNYEDMCLVIMDDDKTDKPKKDMLRECFLEMRKRARVSLMTPQHLWHIHDAMYFGDSRDSAGLQVADTCSYFMLRQLCGKPDDYGFYQRLNAYAISAKPAADSEWAKYADVFVSHQPSSEAS